MQRILNSTGEAFVYGEHVGFLEGVARSYFSLFRHHSVINNPEGNNYFRKRNRADLLKAFDFAVATHTGFTYAEIKDNFRLFVERSINSHRFSGRWGFKEIHYGIRDDTFYFLKELFNLASFVFIVRNPVHQISSKLARGWWPTDSFEDNLAIWRLQVANFKKYAIEPPQHCQFVRYEDFSTNSALVESILSKLELPFGKRQHHVLTGRKIGATKERCVLSDAQKEAIICQCVEIGVYSKPELENACTQTPR